MSAYLLYRLEMAKLRALAKQRDFSPTGDAQYYNQYNTVRTAYLALCLENHRQRERSH